MSDEKREVDSSRDHAPMAGSALEEWCRPPPHFKPDPRWQRQPQSDEEWDRFQDPHDDGDFRAKRRLAFAGDLADPRAPAGMAIVSRWDVSLVLGRLTWLEARFENTRETLLPPLQCNAPVDAIPGMTPFPASAQGAEAEGQSTGTNPSPQEQEKEGLEFRLAGRPRTSRRRTASMSREGGR